MNRWTSRWGWTIALLLVIAPIASFVTAQTRTATAEDVSAVVARIHDAERVNLGAASTRESRNAFFARAIGLIRFGSATYGLPGDSQWCIKNGGAGRPQSDDVVVRCATRDAWDLIGGSGADGYRFVANGIGILPAEQEVYPPPRPADAGPVVPPPTPPPPPLPVDVTALTAKVDALTDMVRALTAQTTALGVAVEAARAEAEQAKIHASDLRHVDVPAILARPVTGGCLMGRVPKAFGGSSTVTFCPAP